MGKNSSRGHLARQVGNSFEAIFEVHCRQSQMGFTKIPDGCRRIKTPYGIKLVPCRTPFDYFICKDGRAAAIDCKTIDSDTFSYSAIDRHQAGALYEISSHVAAGYVVWFRTINKICFFNGNILMALTQRNSLKPEDGLFLGSIDRFHPEMIIKTHTLTSQQGTLI